MEQRPGQRRQMNYSEQVALGYRHYPKRAASGIAARVARYQPRDPSEDRIRHQAKLDLLANRSRDCDRRTDDRDTARRHRQHRRLRDADAGAAARNINQRHDHNHQHARAYRRGQYRVADRDSRQAANREMDFLARDLCRDQRRAGQPELAVDSKRQRYHRCEHESDAEERERASDFRSVERFNRHRERILDHRAGDSQRDQQRRLAPQRRARRPRAARAIDGRLDHLIAGINSGMSFDGLLFHLGLRFSTNALTPSYASGCLPDHTKAFVSTACAFSASGSASSA